ncbi:MAG: sulfurtransferase TusA family protein [Brevinematia bacterium]
MEFSVNQSMDLRGVKCPFNYVRTKIKLSEMKLGDILEIFIDDGEPIRNVPKSLEQDGHEIILVEKVNDSFRVVIRKKV